MYSEFGEQLHSINLTAARTKVDLTTICPIEKLAATCQQLEEKLRNRDRDVDSESIPSSRGYFLMLKTDQDDDDGDHEHGRKILMEYRQVAFSISFYLIWTVELYMQGREVSVCESESGPPSTQLHGAFQGQLG